MLIVDITNSQNLAKPLGRVAAAASKRDEIQKCVLLTSDDDGLLLTAVDTHTHQLTLRVPESQKVDDGQVLITASTLKELVSTFETQPLSLALDEAESQLHVQSEGDYKLGIFRDPVDKFPVELTLPPVVGLVEAERLSEALDAAADLCAENEFVVMTVKGDQLSIYTRGKGVMFSRTSLQIRESAQDWSIAIPVAVLGHLPPKMTGTAELCIDLDAINGFAICAGREHLLIRQVAPDNYSHLVDAMLDAPAPDFYTLKTDGLQRDLKRASIFKDTAGLRLRPDGEYVVAECKSTMGSLKTPHVVTAGGLGGQPAVVNTDPALLGQAIKALSCVDVVIEQVKTLVPAAFEGDEDQEGITMRLYDVEAPNHRVIVLGTLAA